MFKNLVDGQKTALPYIDLPVGWCCSLGSETPPFPPKMLALDCLTWEISRTLLRKLMQGRIVICLVAVWSIANWDLLMAQQSFTVSASHFGGGLDMRRDWKVQLVRSEITIERSGRTSRVKYVSTGALNGLRQSLRENDIFALRNVYGCSACSDNPSCTLEITDGVSTRRVQVYANFPHDRVDVQDTAEVSRFFSVWEIIKRLAGLSSVKDACR